jgi:hypothetical protein
MASGLAMMICAFIPPMLPLLSIALFMSGLVVFCWIDPEKNINVFRTNKTLTNLAKVKSTGNSIQHAYSRFSLLSRPVAEQKQAEVHQPLLRNTLS